MSKYLPSRSLSYVLSLAAALLVATLATPFVAQAQPPLLSPPDHAPGQILVLLEPGAAAPDQVVASHRRGEALPGNLGAGQPQSVRHLLTDRARGQALAALQENPNSSRARLERYLVFDYPENANVEQILEALKRNPNVEHAHRSRVFQLSAPVNPSDPLFPVQSSPQ
ncbi:MAG TPA: hypothetical protein VKU40_12535, partial [Thermoanaerobaculia bacterium]|nr:hypothetical protein [Thermoanaerobaculia bacterium]